MINILKKLLDLIYDTNCYFCKKSRENTVFCSKCYNSVELLSEYPVFQVLNKPVYAVSYYRDVVQKLIRAVKYHDKKDLAKFQAKLMFEYWKKTGKNKKYTVIPVPMFYSKARKRKYNHMDLVCEEFCNLTGYKLDKQSLIRNRETKAQYKLTKTEREKNLKDAFSIVNTNIEEPILLMDDISTTGTTLKEIVKLLQNSGINKVTCLVTAIPEKPSNYIY